MKIRKGFVSNSSSSSFTCDVCNETQSGWDLCLSDAGMRQCVNGHTWCEGHGEEWEPSFEEKKEAVLTSWRVKKNQDLVPIVRAATEETFEGILEKHSLYYPGNDWDSGYDLPASACPICSFGNVHERDAFLYLLKVAGRDEADLLHELKERFSSYGEMKQWLRE